MLSEKARQLAERVQHLEVVRQQATQARAFRTRIKKITEPTRSLAPLVPYLQQFRANGIQVDLPMERIEAFKTRAAKLAAEFEANPSSLIGPDGENRFTFWDALADLPRQVESALKTAWAKHVQESLPTGQSELLVVLGNLPGFDEHVKVIKENQQAAAVLAATLPGPNGFNELSRRARVLRQTWEQLPTGEISSEIMTFLKAASQRQATLQQVTPTVSDWLKRHNLLKAFKVTL